MAYDLNFQDVFLGAEDGDLNEYLTPVIARHTGPLQDPEDVATGPIQASNGHISLIRNMAGGGVDPELSRLVAEEDLPTDDEGAQLDDAQFSYDQIEGQASSNVVDLAYDDRNTTEQPTEQRDAGVSTQHRDLPDSQVDTNRVDLVSMTGAPNPAARSRAQGPASCPICNAGPFSKSFELTSHMRVHSSGDWFCPVAECKGESFKRKCDYARHAVTHDPPDYSCPFCRGKKISFNRSDVFNRHMKSHHKNIPKTHPELVKALEIGDNYAKEVRKRAVAAHEAAKKGFDISQLISLEPT